MRASTAILCDEVPSSIAPRLRLHAAVLCAGLLGVLALACTTQDDGDRNADEAAISAAADESALIVTDGPTIDDLEKHGLSFSTMVGAKGASGEALLDSKIYEAIVDTIKADLHEIHNEDPESGLGFGTTHRQFDPAWLASKESRFELVGVVNRTDKMDASSCGEFRLIYRLAYTAKKTAGRLPMTVSLIFPQPEDGQQCATVAQRWLSMKAGSGAALLDGPLKGHGPFQTIEINYQAVKLTFDASPDFGGEADYVLRVFSVHGDTVAPAPLPNTPRTDLESAERDELRTWIHDNLDAIDKGTAIVPDKFLATKATSIAPYGISRLANRPFSQLFPDPGTAFRGFALDKTKQLGSTAALLRRLDTMTCHGCHQARSIAGFHLAGEERDRSVRLNALTVGRSPHLQEELAWRTQALSAIANKQPLAAPRPFAEHGSKDGGFGTHCGLGDSGFRSWTCPSGFQCVDTHGDVVGVCSPSGGAVGDLCEVGHVTQNADPREDKVTHVQSTNCDPDPALGPNSADTCMSPSHGNGFPDGVCFALCKKSDGGNIHGTTNCGGIPSKVDLQKCIEVDRKPFLDCLEATMTPMLLETCDAKQGCRDDYACMRVEKGPVETGACMPPYFAFQLRVDGHMFDD
jgi:hypothetical protein